MVGSNGGKTKRNLRSGGYGLSEGSLLYPLCSSSMREKERDRECDSGGVHLFDFYDYCPAMLGVIHVFHLLSARIHWTFSIRLRELRVSSPSELGLGFSEEGEEDEVHNGVRGEPNTSIDGGSKGERQEVQRARLCDQRSMQEDEGDVESSSSSLRLLDIRASQCSDF
ncbi:hypothetical protein RJ641_002618 [Dillenia turbinata]|uniref:Uncharacterized protein n=1 Tax=Dillenia turbinata TaxID=194707 RepID=A0AAN8ZDE7_9MAGN